MRRTEELVLKYFLRRVIWPPASEGYYNFLFSRTPSILRGSYMGGHPSGRRASPDLPAAARHAKADAMTPPRGHKGLHHAHMNTTKGTLIPFRRT